MGGQVNTPTFHGDPEDWWRQASPISEAEAAERKLGSWYISDETRSPNQGKTYRVSVATRTSNEARKAKLQLAVASGQLIPEAFSTKVRRLIEVDLPAPDWWSAPLVMADTEIGGTERALWRRAGSKWQLVFDPRVSVGERTMLQLHATVAVVTEG